MLRRSVILGLRSGLKTKVGERSSASSLQPLAVRLRRSARRCPRVNSQPRASYLLCSRSRLCSAKNARLHHGTFDSSTRMQTCVSPLGCGSEMIYFMIAYWSSNGVRDTMFYPARLCELPTIVQVRLCDRVSGLPGSEDSYS
jgi:hypothetical protein